MKSLAETSKQLKAAVTGGRDAAAAAEWNNLTRKQKRARRKKMKRKQKRVCICFYLFVLCISVISSYCCRSQENERLAKIEEAKHREQCRKSVQNHESRLDKEFDGANSWRVVSCFFD